MQIETACNRCRCYHFPLPPCNEDDKHDDTPCPGLQPSPPHGTGLLLTPTGHSSTPPTTAPHARLIPCQHHRVNTPAQNSIVTATHMPKRQRLPHPHPLALTSTSHCQAVLQTPHHPSCATLPSPSPLLCAILPTLVHALPYPLNTCRYSPSPPLHAILVVSPTLACALPLTLTSAIALSKECPLLPVLPSRPPWHVCPHVPLTWSLTHTAIT